MVPKSLRSLALGCASAAVWPSYLLVLAYVARHAPWSRGVAGLVSAVLVGVAQGAFAHGFWTWFMRPGGWAERFGGTPGPVVRPLGRAGRFLIIVAMLTLLPVRWLEAGLIAPEGRLLSAPALGRFLVLAFELAVWMTLARLLRGRSPIWDWLGSLGAAAPGEASIAGAAPAAEAGPPRRSRTTAVLHWIGRRRRLTYGSLLTVVAAVIALDAWGYGYSAHRLAIAWTETILVLAAAMAANRAASQAIHCHADRSTRHHHGSWTMALTSTVAFRAASRTRRAPGLDFSAAPAPSTASAAPTSIGTGAGASGPAGSVHDLSKGLSRLVGFLIAVLAALAIARCWELNLALVKFLLNQPLWPVGEHSIVTLGDGLKAAVFIAAGALACRYMNALFTVTLFHRMPDDPGARFAIVMLCRYAAMGLAAIAAMGSLRIDMASISVVVAALGVGIGFGLQEILSNFVCGVILLLERPIRIGDIVTVGDTTGRVDRIQIRATTIINGDNQCMIVPNREFITGKPVNWTHQDKIMRVPIKLGVEYGNDPDHVAELLLSLARRDPDVLFSPAPAAMLDGFGDSALSFALYVYVAEPGKIGPVRHRLCAEIQRRFEAEGIGLPCPTRRLRIEHASAEGANAAVGPEEAFADEWPRGGRRADPASPQPSPASARLGAGVNRDQKVSG